MRDAQRAHFCPRPYTKTSLPQALPNDKRVYKQSSHGVPCRYHTVLQPVVAVKSRSKKCTSEHLCSSPAGTWETEGDASCIRDSVRVYCVYSSEIISPKNLTARKMYPFLIKALLLQRAARSPRAQRGLCCRLLHWVHDPRAEPGQSCEIYDILCLHTTSPP